MQVRILLAHVVAIATDGAPAPPPVVPRDGCGGELRTLYEELVDAAVGDPQADVPRALEEIPLVCAISRKTLKDPVSVDEQIVNRGVLILRQLGGELHQPTPEKPFPAVQELDGSKLEELMQISLHCRALLSPKFWTQSVQVLYVERLSAFEDPLPLDLAVVGRNFAGAIRCANETDLVTRGPLDLKATSVVPPQIVLDNKVCVWLCSVLACSF